MIVWTPGHGPIPAPLLKAYVQAYRQYRQMGCSVPQALRLAREAVIDGEAA
jgi:hypothetical protein